MKNKHRPYARIVLWLFMVAILIVVMRLASKHGSNETMTGINIEIDEMENAFIDRDEIKILIQQFIGDSINGFPRDGISYSSLEKELNENPFIASVDAYPDMNGLLHINIVQRRPVFRVINKEGVSYYIDNHGDVMPLSSKFTSRVIVATGNIEDENWYSGGEPNQLMNDLTSLAMFFESQPFYKAITEQVYVNERNEFEIVPKFGNHSVLLGDLENLDEKMKKLRLFYAKTVKNTDWNQYSQLNLKFNDQVVCTKK